MFDAWVKDECCYDTIYSIVVEEGKLKAVLYDSKEDSWYTQDLNDFEIII